jgi:hypothetical protein
MLIGPDQFRLGLGHLGFIDSHLGQIRRLLNHEKQFAGSYIVAFPEIYLLEESFDPGPQVHGLNSLNVTDVFGWRIDILNGNRRYLHQRQQCTSGTGLSGDGNEWYDRWK